MTEAVVLSDAEVVRDAAPLDDGAATPLPALDGTALTVELVHGAESYYLAPMPEDGGDRENAPRVRDVSGGSAYYDPWLSRAAREIAVQGAILGTSPPEPVLSFILRSFGAPEGSVAQMLVKVSGDDPGVVDHAVASALEAAPQGSGRLLVGVGEAAVESGEHERRLVVVSARRDFELAPTTRTLEMGEIWRIGGRAPTGFADASASVLYPDHSIVVLPVEMSGHDFSVQVPAGELQGTVRVSIDGVGLTGPGKLLQLQAEVGGEVPTSIEVLLPPAETFSELQDAEAYALERLNYDRRTQGLEMLELDAVLSDVARAHSQEMRDESYFAHQSPTTGLAADRIRNARYAATTNGENLAFNDSIAEAQSSLMESVGHRRNLVSPRFTHVGIGLAREDSSSGKTSWHLTQLFARKVVPLDAQEVAKTLVEAINAHRSELGLDPLEVREELVALAQEGCERALTDKFSDVPSDIAPRASRVAHGRVSVSAHAFYELATLDVAELGVGEEFVQIGLALLRDPESLEGRTFLVVVVAEPG
ncbi:MAG: CAP domain-containing protein [Myxococcales bacterium]|nr:CAP domain-containing protein [Myxococcales bacterium]